MIVSDDEEHEPPEKEESQGDLEGEVLELLVAG